ncbi:hypothetical protein [Bradyrhizobium iriomotense]|uniref:Uncharacterized protein n=1 Tax=Bradyrhizobium iriomotense TaxID=441950 RepID=A0ABQ6BGQ4_9BRAD|nr:hypothetical protein [Bradyrhizobium iriomotense]GLR91367.1 hypothetical protein GCM10007857_80840 [Bradyrhizobium iriomotense]
MRGNKRAAFWTRKLRKRFGDDWTLRQVDEFFERKRTRSTGRPQKWDDDIAGDVYLMVRGIMSRGFKKTESLRMLAQYPGAKGGWFSFEQVKRGFRRGEENLGKLLPKELDQRSADIFEWMPLLKIYVDGQKPKLRK